MDSLNRGWISHLRKSEAHFNLPAINVCVCAAGALLNFTLLLYLWCNIPGCECSVRGKKRTCCFLVIFSFFPQQVGNKPTSSLSIFSSYKMKTEIVPPPPLPRSLAPDKLCSLQFIQYFSSWALGKQKNYFRHTVLFLHCCIWLCAIKPAWIACWQHLCISYGSWSQIDTRNPYIPPLSGNGGQTPLMSLCPCSVMEDAQLWESGLCD